ncbi:MAG: hypothetical protein DRJ05_16810, partial [Bacteroidetes bacterium]
IQYNNTLGICDARSICEYLVSPNGSVAISGNPSNCSTKEQIEDACAAHCLVEGIVFTSQSEIDDYQINYPDCNSIEGDVTIMGADIENLNGLSNLISIWGNLTISQNPLLPSLVSLNNLDLIGGDLIITGNENLISFSGMSYINSIYGNLEIIGNNIASLNGLYNLESVWGDLIIKQNPLLVDLEELGNLIYIAGNLDIGINASMTSLNGLESITNIGGSVEIYENALSSIDGLQGIASTGENLVLSGISDIVDLSSLNSDLSIGANITISSNPNLLNLEGLENINHINGTLSIENNLSLISLSGIGYWVSIGENLSIAHNPELANLQGLNYVFGVGGDLTVFDNQSLDDISGLHNISNIGGLLSIHENGSLTSLSGLGNINPGSIIGLSIFNNGLLTTCDVQSICDYLASPNGTIEVYNNYTGCNSPEEVEAACVSQCLPNGITFMTQEQIDDFQTDYPDCTEIEGDVEIEGNTITNLDGLINIQLIDGELEIHDNNQLSSLLGLASLSSINGSISIHNNPQLSNINGLNSITNIDGHLFVSYNQNLVNFSGLVSLTTIDYSFNVSFNDALIDFNGLYNLISIGNLFTIDSNPALEDMTGLNQLENVGGSLTFFNNTSLANMSGLESLTSVGSNLYIEDNPLLASVTALSGITEIGNMLYISNNDAIASLSGLDSIQPNSITDLTITNNETLSTCHVQSICDYLISPNGTILIENNAPGCNTQTEVYDACWVKVNEASAIENKIQIFPNPAKNTITILNPSKVEIKEVIIYSPSGSVILQKKSAVNTIDISKLQPGLYFVEVKTEMGNVRRKLIVE